MREGICSEHRFLPGTGPHIKRGKVVYPVNGLDGVECDGPWANVLSQAGRDCETLITARMAVIRTTGILARALRW